MSSLPDWYYAQERRKQALTDRINADPALAINRPIRDSFHTAPGWRSLGVAYQAWTPDALYPWTAHLEVFRAIWAFDPDVVPMWSKWIFLNETAKGGRMIVLGRHCIGRRVHNLHEQPIESIIDMPTLPIPGANVPIQRPNKIEFHMPRNILDTVDDLPIAPFEPISWKLYYEMRASWKATEEFDVRQYLIDVEAERFKRKRLLDEEHEYMLLDVGKFVESKLDNVSEVEMKEYALRPTGGLPAKER